MDTNTPATTRLPRENAYICDANHATVTVDVDVGVTPANILCKHPGCRLWARSSFYPRQPRPDTYPEPSHEWYRPCEAEANKLDAETRKHVDQGGLLIRPRTDAEPIYHGQENEADSRRKLSSDPRIIAGHHRLRAALDAGVKPAFSGKIGRNKMCPCGSGKKFKKCCLKK